MPHPPVNSPKFVYAFISTNALGEEGPLAAYRNGWLPLVVTREELLNSFEAVAQEIGQATGVKVERRVYQMIENAAVVDARPTREQKGSESEQ